MAKVRRMPVLLLSRGRLVKTTRFRRPCYVGDPVNTVRIFNELGVDELVAADISASRSGRGPDFGLIREIAEECFMPLTYGGGVRDLSQVEELLMNGVEKILIRRAFFERPDFVSEVADRFGSQAVVVAIDAVRSRWGNFRVLGAPPLAFHKKNAIDAAIEAEVRGAGEIFLTSVDAEGSWQGFDYELIQSVSEAVKVPLVAHGGAGTAQDIHDLSKSSLVSGVGVGSMAVFQSKGKGVLVGFPDGS